MCINDRSMHVVAQLNQCANIENHPNMLQNMYTVAMCMCLIAYLSTLLALAVALQFSLFLSLTIYSFVRSAAFLAHRSQKSESSCTNQQYYKDICCRCEFEYVSQYHVMIYSVNFTPSIWLLTLKCLHIVLYNLNELFGTFAYTRRFVRNTLQRKCVALKDEKCR